MSPPFSIPSPAPDGPPLNQWMFEEPPDVYVALIPHNYFLVNVFLFHKLRASFLTRASASRAYRLDFSRIIC
jgi:hypothetical protein